MRLLLQAKQFAVELRAGLLIFSRSLSGLLKATRVLDAVSYGLVCILVLMPISFVGKGLNWVLTIENAWVALAVVGFSAVLLLLFAALMTNEQFLREIQLQGIRWPSLLSVALGSLAVVVFGGLSCGFERVGIVEIFPIVPFADGCASRYADFYLWHLLDSIPGIKFNETVGWVQRYRYSDHLSAWLLLSFKVLVIVSVIGSFVVSGRLRRENVHRARRPINRRTRAMPNPSLERTSTGWPRYARCSFSASRGQPLPAPHLKR